MSLRTYLICRIIFTFLFLIISTTIWFNRRDNLYHDVKTNIIHNDIVFKDINKYSDNIYNLKIENKDNSNQNIKVYIVPVLLKDNISNNYIKYQINDSDIKTLNMDGMIMVSDIESSETINLNLKVWVSDTYTGNLTYDGRIVVA